MGIKTIKRILSENKKVLEKKYKIKTIGVFGSSARGDSTAGSDVDILVEFTRSPDMFEFIKLEKFLGSKLGTKVDLVTRKALKPVIKKNILRETVFL